MGRVDVVKSRREIEIGPLPFPLVSEGPPSQVGPLLEGERLVLTADAGADMFLDPGGDPGTSDAERFVWPVAGDFRFSAFVSPVFVSDFDSGVLLGYIDPLNWFKVCAELDPSGTTRVVSVVTRNGTSDDCDSWPIDGSGTYLRISRLGQAFALHASIDGQWWNMVRYFGMGEPAPDAVKIGFAAQSPSGEGTTATFSEIRFDTRRPAGVRDGS
jgi:regulation of enolase protein 1 (concanavalin A-like superfamily)